MKKIEDRINKILSGSVADPKEQELYLKALETLDSAAKDMTKALVAGDNEAFSKARDRQVNAGAVVKMYRERAEKRESGPLITEAEYKELVTAIEEKQAELTAKAKKEAVVYCQKLQALAEENARDIGHANSLLHVLQCDIYKWADCSKRKDGNPILTSASEKQIKDYTVPAWVSFSMDSAQYKAMTKGIVADGKTDKK